MRRVRSGYRYDVSLDIFNSKQGRKILASFKNASPLQKALRGAKGQATLKQKRAKANVEKLSQQQRREIAEENAAETVRLAVRAMQQALLTLQDIPAPTQYHSVINPHVVHNAIFMIREKSGVRFPPDVDEQFNEKITMDSHAQKYVPLWERDKEADY